MKKIIISKNLVVGLIFLVFSIIFYFFIIPTQIQESSGMPAALSPSLFCRISLIFLMLLSLILIVISQHQTETAESRQELEEENRGNNIRGLVSVSVAILYIVLISTLGFFTSTTLVVLFFTLYFGSRNWKLITLTLVILLPFIYLLFVKGLNVVLPSGLLF